MTGSVRLSRRGLLLAGGGALLAAPFLSRGALAATTLRYGHMHTPNSIAGMQAQWFADAVAEKTGGEIAVQIFPNSQLGKLQELAEAVSTGSIAFSHNTAGAVGSLYEPFAAFDTPYLYRDVDHLMAVMDAESPVMQELNEGLVEASGTRALYAFYFGTRNLTADRAVKTPADLAGVKIRSIPFPIYMATVEGLGAVPVPVDWSEVPTALATGVVNGQENPMNVLVSAKLYEVQSHLMLTGHIAAAQVVMMNDDVWQGLPDAQKEAVAAAAAETRARASQEMLAAEATDLEALKAAGMTVVDEAGGLDLAAFRESVKARVSQEFDGQWGELYGKIAAVA
ncbi:TRAP transporter substrate-binding protein [Cereibacter sphaeroides]|uniref:TRAP transporter substrate-binding protein n=1 Tax=Cereibacter sphaeroides TaxID=1063 RepID=UPI000191CBA0|nr:TRAP transporter substrate-binding protein [Cereibacter sphaeroides]ACM03997.1 periplasmic substrate-binding protein [Cereibacter sphaeroides KD131]EKX55950.1 TRAP-type C4-dicarboxylate transport system, periplasmic component [Rhodobacter sp. AKP1]